MRTNKYFKLKRNQSASNIHPSMIDSLYYSINNHGKNSSSNQTSKMKLTPYQKLLFNNRREKLILNSQKKMNNTDNKLSNEPFMNKHFSFCVPKLSKNIPTKQMLSFFKMKTYFNQFSNKKSFDVTSASINQYNSTTNDITKKRKINKSLTEIDRNKFVKKQAILNIKNLQKKTNTKNEGIMCRPTLQKLTIKRLYCREINYKRKGCEL